VLGRSSAHLCGQVDCDQSWRLVVAAESYSFQLRRGELSNAFSSVNCQTCPPGFSGTPIKLVSGRSPSTLRLPHPRSRGWPVGMNRIPSSHGLPAGTQCMCWLRPTGAAPDQMDRIATNALDVAANLQLSTSDRPRRSNSTSCSPNDLETSRRAAAQTLPAAHGRNPTALRVQPEAAI